MMTPKEALIKDGTIAVREGRGRLSREAVDRCKYLVAHEGYSIRGYEVSKAPAPTQTTTTTTVAAPVVNKVAVANVKEVREFTILWDEKAYKAIDANKKEHSMRWVCDTCKVSLVQCGCGKPSIHQGTKLSIVPR